MQLPNWVTEEFMKPEREAFAAAIDVQARERDGH